MDSVFWARIYQQGIYANGSAHKGRKLTTFQNISFNKLPNALLQSEWLLEIAPHFYKSSDIEDSTTKKMPKTVGKTAE